MGGRRGGGRLRRRRELVGGAGEVSWKRVRGNEEIINSGSGNGRSGGLKRYTTA